ncbi:LacI family transcriptional regulator [Phycicoccus sp. MAQZ13P-2]|uniref:LacI family DNA-binding transcriptional regulator n=1 Tax=Phycicoccus mangrovi TaxID=2840470 RepID=UPI001C003E37|nr:LacI family DNA-binding transcriptional regulator [Phycicoccus mangrovi]MBT9255548.1 LacI family transcriptional regulator [Phycicoccus mangrovi]MBT9275262.1 LacI family transcriptional regulator [Phycicoccus mangrovi]
MSEGDVASAGRGATALDPAAGARGRVVTLRDIADEAGVSISTVSRVLDERTPRSGNATAQRVREVADRMGYRRNTVASALRRGSTGTIGVVVPRLTDAVMAMVYEAIERAARARGLFAVVTTSGDDPDDEREAVETLLDRTVEGLVLASVRLDDDLPERLRTAGVPHVLVIRTDDVSPSSLGDDEMGGWLATRHLLDLGHERIGLVTGPGFASSARDRLRGARRALEEAGVEVPEGWVVGDGYRTEHGIAAAERLFAGPDRPTAVFAANDNLALGVMAVAHRRRMVVGEDLALVGYNDTPVVANLSVPITSVRVPFDQIATTALDLLLSPGGRGGVRRAMPTLIPRASSGRPLR